MIINFQGAVAIIHRGKDASGTHEFVCTIINKYYICFSIELPGLEKEYEDTLCTPFQAAARGEGHMIIMDPYNSNTHNFQYLWPFRICG